MECKVVFGKTFLNELKKWSKLSFIEAASVFGIRASAVDPELTFIEFLKCSSLSLMQEDDKSAGIAIEKVEK